PRLRVVGGVDLRQNENGTRPHQAGFPLAQREHQALRRRGTRRGGTCRRRRRGVAVLPRAKRRDADCAGACRDNESNRRCLGGTVLMKTTSLTFIALLSSLAACGFPEPARLHD